MRRYKYASMALSLGVVLALILNAIPDDSRLVEVKAAPAPATPAPQSMALAEVSLPPPPAPKRPRAKPATPSPKITPLRPTPVKTPVRSRPPAPVRDMPATVTPDVAATVQGRTLLRLLEHGAGPAIEIAWPESRDDRARLYRRFRGCFGMRVALLADGKRLFVADGAPGTPWRLNLDRFSGFMRQHGGRAAAMETRELDRIRARHGLRSRGVPVRLFPRAVDAAMLGGLRRIIGAGYAGRGMIRARYVLDRGRLLIGDIRVDGAAVPGRIDLGACPRGRPV